VPNNRITVTAVSPARSQCLRWISRCTVTQTLL